MFVFHGLAAIHENFVCEYLAISVYRKPWKCDVMIAKIAMTSLPLLTTL